MDSLDSSDKPVLLGKRKGPMADNVKRILDGERFWSQWKESKCPNFERPSSEACKARKMTEQPRVTSKLMGQAGLLIQAREGELNDRRNGQEMRKYFRHPKEQQQDPTHIVACTIPSITDHQYPFLCD